MESQSKGKPHPKASVSNEDNSENQSRQDQKPTILILDDDENICQMLQDKLEALGFKSYTAHEEASALHITKTLKPEVALVDFKLEKITGIEVAHHLRKIDPDLPVIIMTAYASLELAVKAIQSDIYDFLAKPVDTTYLVRSISKASEKRRLTIENKQLIESLRVKNVDLEALNDMKTKFLSVVTHDLRTPLTSIRGYAEMLHSLTNITEEEKTRCFSSIEKSVTRMNNLINNLMDMVSIEAGKLRVEKTIIEYVSICRELQGTFKPMSEKRKVKVIWELPAKPIKLLGDSHRLVQVFTNFIANAFKHTKPGDKITVRVSIKDKEILSEIIDDGEGISKEDQNKIFEHFFQVESSVTRREGLGLGLTIAKEIILAHDGKVGVFSKGIGLGAKFWFSLPISKS